ncbi:MAG: RNase J family beta-CASP ribonuclease, partial [Actinomycetota bacterium]|nr:RNase J family beta-CASP ribonuclease [Actinomycetota bacterium]
MTVQHDEIPSPAPLKEGALRVLPIGGLGEIGRNMAVFDFDGSLLNVDCGVLFPAESPPGVDFFQPDITPHAER